VTEYHVPHRFYERLSLESEEEKRATRREIIAWVVDNLGSIIWIPDADAGEPVACARMDYVVQ
jgi:hypothetical protein